MGGPGSAINRQGFGGGGKMTPDEEGDFWKGIPS